MAYCMVQPLKQRGLVMTREEALNCIEEMVEFTKKYLKKVKKTSKK